MVSQNLQFLRFVNLYNSLWDWYLPLSRCSLVRRDNYQSDVIFNAFELLSLIFSILATISVKVTNYYSYLVWYAHHSSRFFLAFRLLRRLVPPILRLEVIDPSVIDSSSPVLSGRGRLSGGRSSGGGGSSSGGGGSSSSVYGKSSFES